jgi:hypothetical protein
MADDLDWRRSYQSQVKRYYEALHRERAQCLDRYYYVDGESMRLLDMDGDDIAAASRELARRHCERAINKRAEAEAYDKQRKGIAL